MITLIDIGSDRVNRTRMTKRSGDYVKRSLVEGRSSSRDGWTRGRNDEKHRRE